MGTVTKSGQNNITSPAGNSLAVFVDGKTNILKLKDIEGNIEPLSNYITGGGGGGTAPVIITKTDIDNLISTNSLVAGTLYEITGVHPTLYDDGTNSGTTIYLQAITTNKLSAQGNGVFYNPKYDQSIDGFGIWSNRSSWLSSQSKVSILGTTGVYPSRITIDSVGNIYTVNGTSNNVSKITPDGTSTILGTTGTFPYGITIDTDGNIYTANSGSNNVSKITPDGTSTILGTTGNSPFSITIDSVGNIYTANSGSNNVSKITPDGTSTILGTTGNSPRGITIDGDGNIYTANNASNNVSKITPLGVSTILGTTGDSPFSITIDNVGNIYTVNGVSNNVSKITPLGVSTILATTGDSPIGITIDGDGNIYTSNAGSNNVSKITPLGVSTILGTIEGIPSGIIIYEENCYTSNLGSNNVSKISLLDIIIFEANEPITANNGATGQLFFILETNMFIALTGDWASATSITGDNTGATANVTDIVLKSYTIDGKAIWGGYSWTNLTGNIGSSIDVLNLDPTDWSKDVYDETNYNKVVDIIEYDIENDFISRRYEVEANNDVKNTYENDIYFNQNDYLNSISVFMFGNGFEGNTGKGIGNNIVESSYFECVDFQGSFIYSNTLNISSINSNTLTTNSNIYSNTLINSSIYSNTLSINSNIYSNTLINSSIYSNTLSINSNINSNTLNNNGNIVSNTVTTSYINSNILTDSHIESNTVTTSYINSNILTISNINLNTLNNSYIDSNTLNSSNIEIGLANILDGKLLHYITMEKAIIDVDVSGGTILFSTYPKTVYSRPDGIIKVRYFNDSDVLVIASITD